VNAVRVDPIPRLALGAEEAAKALGVSRDFLDEHVAPELRAVRSGRKKLYPVRELERWLAENASRITDEL
jgi:excisionase family DNA binding protein